MGLLSALRGVVAMLCLCVSSDALTASPSEYEVKAVFLFNFSQFVEWPADAFTDSQAPLVLGTLGEDPFGRALDEIVQGETVRGRTLTVRRFARVEDIDACHILFIHHTVAPRVHQTLRQLNARGCLTVSDADDFARSGGIIQFVTMGNRIRLQINLDAAKLANLTISSKLLRPAHIVTTAGR